MILLNYFFCETKSVFNSEFNTFNVIWFTLGTKNFEVLYYGAPIFQKMDLKGGHLSTVFLCTLPRPYKIQGLVPTALIFLCYSTVRAIDDFKDLKYSLIHF